MLSAYIDARFVVPENPVMRGYMGMPVIQPAASKPNSGLPMGIGTYFGAGSRSQRYGNGIGSLRGLGCADSLNWSFGFPMGVNGLGGLGDAGTFVNNLTSGNFSDALMGNDFFSGVPNVVVIVGGLWLFSKVSGDFKKVSGKVKKYTRKKKAAEAQ